MKKVFRGKTLYVLGISLLLSFAALALSLFVPDFLKPSENFVFDTYQQLKPRKGGGQSEESIVKIVDIDERSIKAVGQWPWPRSDLANLVNKLANAGVLSVGFDLVFSETDRTNPSEIARRLPANAQGRDQIAASLRTLPENDVLFRDAIADAPVSLGFFKDNSPQPVDLKAGVSWLGENLAENLDPMNGAVASLPMFQEVARGQGFITIGTDNVDEIIRAVPMFAARNDKVYPALSIESLRIAIESASQQRKSFIIKTTYSGTEGGSVDGASGNNPSITYGRVANLEFPLTANGELLVYYSQSNASQFVSAVDVLEKDDQWLAEQFEGRIALVGTSAVGLRDIRKTTLREAVPGVFVHAQIIDQIMEGNFLHRPDWAPGAETILGILLTLIAAITIPLSGALGAAFVGAGCALLTIAVSWYAFVAHGYLINPAPPMAVSFGAYLLMSSLMFFFAEKEKRFVRNAFQHYLAPDLLAKLENEPDALKLGGEIREMTLMFMDVRNFTSISEKLSPEDLVSFLNTLLSPLSDIIQENEGAIDKYIGDSIMAFWNAPLDVEDHPQKACRAALAMLAKIRQMNDADAFGFKALGLGEVAIGVGINTGMGCVGNMGSKSRFDYSVIGDAVNIAARLESATKEAGWPLLVSNETAENCPGFALLDAGKLELKGKSTAQQVFALIGDETFAESASFQALKRDREVRARKGKTRTKAKSGFSKTADPELLDFLNR